MDELRDKLNEMFDIEGASIVKTQCNVAGRWLFTIAMTVFFCGIYAVLVWGSMVFYGQALFIFLIALLSVVLAFLLFRIWLGFAVDIVSRKFAEQITFVRGKGDERYFYSRGNYVEKFEFSRGFICVCGKSYDKYEDKSNYSQLAGRYNKSLQRRSSLFSTLAPSFWYEKIRELNYKVTESGVTAEGAGESIKLTCGEDGKIKDIIYRGSGYELYDSASPIKFLDCKLPGKYRMTYSFTCGARQKIELRELFGTAMEDYIITLPDSEYVTVERKEA